MPCGHIPANHSAFFQPVLIAITCLTLQAFGFATPTFLFFLSVSFSHFCYYCLNVKFVLLP